LSDFASFFTVNPHQQPVFRFAVLRPG